ncbi:MAG: LacI family DNA-binding transcriptional regulator [Chloroflexi bacterium]|nr:LacI family DNA-binding transcriptional regulator [Chloroflexota bacterium]
MKKKTQKDSRASQIDVARLAGVSQAAVSRTFTPGASVSAEVKQQVLDAAEQLGYRPNAIARSLITNSTNIIGIVVVRFANPYYWQIFKGFTQKLQDLGYSTLLLNAAQDQEVEQTLPTALQYQVDGLIITSATLSSKMAEECVRAGTPVVLFNRYEMGTMANAVCCDNVGGGKLVANALLDAGYERLAYLAGEEGSSTNRDREQGFIHQLQTRGHTLAFRESGNEYTYEAGYAAAKRLLQNDPPPNAVFCASDLMAMGMLDATKELGLKIPDDLGIVGFDDIKMVAWPSYAITTIRQPINRMVDTTIEVLLNAIENSDSETVMKWIPATLVERNSTRAVNPQE